MSATYTHTKRWLSSLKVGEKVLISARDQPRNPESDATVTKIGKKYIHVEVDENMPGHVWGTTLVFDKETGQQHNRKKGHWIQNRKLIRFTESRWRKILKIRKAYSDRMRISDAIHHRRIPEDVISNLVPQLESWPYLPGHAKKAKKRKKP